MEGVGGGAVLVLHAVIALGLTGGQLSSVAAVVVSHTAVHPLHQTLMAVLEHDRAVYSAVQSGVDGLRLRGQIDGNFKRTVGGCGGLHSVGGVHGIGGRLGGIGLLAGAGHQSEDHHQSQDQSQELLGILHGCFLHS